MSDAVTPAPAAEKPVDLTIPNEVLIAPTAPKIVPKATLTGDQSLIVTDVMQNKPVEVFLVPTKRFAPESPDEPLVFVQGAVSGNLMSTAVARNKFAVAADGSVNYNPSGFTAGLVDIVKLVGYNHGPGKSKRDAARKQEAAAAKKQADEDKKAAEARKEADAKASAPPPATPAPPPATGG